MSNIALQKLDGRHASSNFFSHRAKMAGMDCVPEWVEIRKWLWENYGPGLERDVVWIIKYHHQEPPKWGWHIDNGKYYLYLKEEVVTHFSLKYLNT